VAPLAPMLAAIKADLLKARRGLSPIACVQVGARASRAPLCAPRVPAKGACRGPATSTPRTTARLGRGQALTVVGAGVGKEEEGLRVVAEGRTWCRTTNAPRHTAQTSGADTAGHAHPHTVVEAVAAVGSEPCGAAGLR
jgi:hypothetical protein